ncbi:hypothetical protein B0O80DRAFT_120237 [Mortierella sp. GBAus27b]|nr:hypothetical protein B0O80DRAFT_120237 [Mortierella sp. GBAus27b]
MEKKTKKDDITNLLSSDHLKSMYARFLSSSQKRLTASDEHPVWHKTEDMIRSSSVMNDLPKAPEGISTTIYAHIREFATNIENHWEGPGYDKLLDYLIRILLRLHLAPLREQKTKDRSTGKLKQTREHPSGQQIRKRRKSKVAKLCNELEEWMRRRPDEQRERISKILGQLHVLGSTESDVKENLIATSEAHPTIIVDEPDSIDMDWELYWDLEEDEQEENQMDGGDSDGTKEPSRAHLKSLQGLLKVLLESPALSDRKINGNYVKKSAFVGNKFTTKECDVVAKIVNTLRPFVPKRRINPKNTGPKTLTPIAHVTLRAPIMIIANAVLRMTGYPHFTRRISPHVSPSSTHTLHLDAIGMYEVLCPKAAGHFDVLDTDRNLLTTVANVRANKEAIFGAFFNTDKMQQLCRQHGLKFADRVSFVDRFTVRIMGEVIQQGPDRVNGPVESQYEARKKNKKARPAMFNWGEEATLRGMDKEEISHTLDAVDGRITELEAKVAPLRKELSRRETAQTSAADHHRSVSSEVKTTAVRKEAYHGLQEARNAVRNCREDLMPLNAEIRHLRRERYYWNNVLKACEDGRKPHLKQKTIEMTTPTVDNFNVEDSVECIDISRLPKNKIVFAGTDPGVKKMNVTCAQTLQEIRTHINRYQVLFRKSRKRCKWDIMCYLLFILSQLSDVHS